MIITNKNTKQLSRPIQMVDGKSYFSTHVEIQKDKTKTEKIWVVASSDFEERYSQSPLEGHKLFSDAPIRISLSVSPPPGSTLSPAAYQDHVLKGIPLPDMGDAFKSAVGSIDRFVSFNGAFASQADMAEFLGCWVVSTYATDVFDTVGYIWPNGEKASGKTQCLKTLMRLAFMGRTVSSSSTFATIRDEASLGATIGFDDCENVKTMDNNKRELLLLGNTKGSQLMFKEPGNREGQWETTYVDPFAPKAFTSISIPDDTLASRTIMIPLVRSDDHEKTRRKPTSDKHWVHQPDEIRDAFWLNVAKALPCLAAIKEEVDESTDLAGRDFDIFQAPLTIALWLQRHHGVDGIFDRMLKVMEAYHASKHETLLPPVEHVVLQAMSDLMNQQGAVLLAMQTKDIVYECSKVLQRWDITDETLRAIDVQKVGKLLGRLGFDKVTSHKNARSWNVTRSKLNHVARQHRHELETFFEDELDDSYLHGGGVGQPARPATQEQDFIPF